MFKKIFQKRNPFTIYLTARHFCTQQSQTAHYAEHHEMFNVQTFNMDIPVEILESAFKAGAQFDPDSPPQIKVISMPPNASLTSPEALHQFMSDYGLRSSNAQAGAENSREKRIFLGVDPMNLIYNARVYQRKYSQKLRNMETGKLCKQKTKLELGNCSTRKFFWGWILPSEKFCFPFGNPKSPQKKFFLPLKPPQKNFFS